MANNDYEIKMDGTPQAFAGGAIRYSKTGKGRFDLIPSDVVCKIITDTGKLFDMGSYYVGLDDIIEEAYSEHYVSVIASLVCFIYHKEFKNPTAKTFDFGLTFNEFMIAFGRMLSDLAIHYEKGAEKYGENNWKKGIPAQSFRDSGLRHLSQWISGETDEPHHIAAIWNFFGLIWLAIQNDKSNNNENHDWEELKKLVEEGGFEFIDESNAVKSPNKKNPKLNKLYDIVCEIIAGDKYMCKYFNSFSGENSMMFISNTTPYASLMISKTDKGALIDISDKFIFSIIEKDGIKSIIVESLSLVGLNPNEQKLIHRICTIFIEES